MYNKPATKQSTEKTIKALAKNGIEAVLAKNRNDAVTKVLKLIPKGSEIMTMTSITLETLGLPEILNGPNYNSNRKQFKKVDKKQAHQIGAAPDYAVGSVHAVSKDGEVFIASASGSQLPAYAYGAEKVIWVVGTQKIVKNREEAIKRIYEYALPLEAVRARKAYNIPENQPGSSVNKLLMIHKEVTPKRITVVFVPENIGY